MQKTYAMILRLIQTALFAFSFQAHASQNENIEYIQNLTHEMNASTIGQPEAVDSFIDLEKAIIFKDGEREKPELIFLLGLPGTGKDTSVESYLRVKHKLLHKDMDANVLTKHLFNVPKLQDVADLNEMKGSSTGYIGSENIPPLIQWLVDHSGGKYKVENVPNKRTKRVVENRDWKPGMVLSGYSAPEDGVLFFNEFHDWKKEMKNVFGKEALEKGKFVIANPNEGLSEIRVPVNIIIASNDGIDLVANRDMKNKRIGKSLSFEELMSRWLQAARDPSKIKQKIKDVSEEMLNRIPNSRVVLMRPLSSESIIAIAKLKLNYWTRFFSRPKEQRPQLAVKTDVSKPIGLTSNGLTPENFWEKYSVLVEHPLTGELRNPERKKEIVKYFSSLIKNRSLRILPQEMLIVHRDKISGELQYQYMSHDLHFIRNRTNMRTHEQMSLAEFLDLSEKEKEVIKAVAESEKEKELRGKFPRFNLTYSNQLIEFISTYQQLPDEGARGVEDRIESVIMKTIQDAYFEGKLDIKEGETLSLDLVKNSDGTVSLKVNDDVFNVKYSEKFRYQQTLTNSKIDSLLTLEDQINKRVVGVSHIAKRISRGLLRAANTPAPRDDSDSKKGADIMMFLGVSSTGKTELVKTINKAYYQTEDDPKVINFKEIQTDQDLQEKFFGRIDPMTNEAIPSEFMKEWDRHQGNFMIEFDEISNANPRLLNALFNILREPIVRTFKDGVPRPMSRVKIAMTGNVGENWYNVIPRDIPEQEQYEGAREIYQQYTENPGYLTDYLKKYFDDAFIARVGLDNIYFFGPHTHESVYSLIHIKLMNLAREMSKPNPEARTWRIKFKSQEDYRRLVDFIALRKFKIWEQGASIERAVQELRSELEYELLKNKIVSQSTVILSIGATELIEVSEGNTGAKVQKPTLNIQVENDRGTKLIPIRIDGNSIPKQVQDNKHEFRRTAYHEAGHEIVREVLLSKYSKPEFIKITPGIAQIGGSMIRYAGVASSDETLKPSHTLEYFIKEMAMLFAGGIAEELVSRNAAQTAGKSNDIQRATQLARTVILHYGLMPEWGNQSLQPGQDVDAFLNSLSSERKAQYEKALSKLLKSAEWLAKKVLISNFDNLLVPVGNRLAEKGQLEGKEITKMYDTNGVILMDKYDEVAKQLKEYEQKLQLERLARFTGEGFYSFVTPPQSVVDVKALSSQKQTDAFASVDLSSANSIVKTSGRINKTSALKCTEVLLH